MNNEDMSEVIKNLSGMLNSNNIPDNVKDVLNNLQSSSSSSVSNTSSNSDVSSERPYSSGVSPEMFEMLSNMLNNSGSSNENNSNSSSDSTGIDMETLLKISNIISKMNSSQNDARSNLLLSLKPYLKESRRNKVEQYVKLLNMSKVLEIINPNGSEKVK